MAAKKLTGVIAAVATAVDETGAPDAARSVKLARFLLDTGCDGLNVLGTTGEATSFALEQRKAVMSEYKKTGLPLDRLMVGHRRRRDLRCDRADAACGGARLCGRACFAALLL